MRGGKSVRSSNDHTVIPLQSYSLGNLLRAMATEIIFHVYSDIERAYIQCSGQENQTLKEAIEMQKNRVLSYPVNEYIFKANVKGHTEQVIVNPNILICGWLEEGTKIQTYSLPESDKKKLPTPPTPTPPVKVENVPNGVSNQSLFFLNIDRLKNARIITHISYDKCKVKNLCVSASSGDTLLEALERDGRFIKPENWTLIRGDNLSKVPVETKANCCEKYFFDVEFKTRKRTSSGVSESGAVEIKKEKIGEDEVNDVSSPSPMSAKRASPVNSFHKKILESAQSHAKKLLAENKRRKLATLIETKFSKLIDQSKSVWLMEELVSASKCVGRINAESGRVAGTCFLVTEDVILTNYHVYKDINDDAASRQDNPKVKVSFNHMWPNQTLNLGEVEVDMKDIRAQCQDESLDYIFLGLKNKGGQPGLSGKISLVDPKNFTNEVVTIIGHPDGREKLIDPDCRIISQHTWRPELLERIQKRQPFEFNPLFTCKEAIMSDKYKQKIAYDTTFFDCSSGSPVFDDQGKVIAMHTCGWVEKRAGIKFSVMEFAIPMEAIYNHCYNNFPQVVALLFPSFSMNVDEQD